MAIIFGRRPVLEALHAQKRSLHKIYLQRSMEGNAATDIRRLAQDRHVALEYVESGRLDRLSSGGNHQGVAAELASMSFWDLDDFLASGGPVGTGPAVLVALDEIQDPQNVGAILRSAGFFGVSGIVLPKWRNAPVSDVAVRVSAGASEYLNYIRVTNLAEAITSVKEAGFDVVGADMEGARIDAQPFSARTMLVLGGEGKGLRRLVRERCSRLVGIPGKTHVGSLNVGAAAAILLYELSKKNGHA
jgi:23S rRNA (guanosine2251-2'-O)-methyltransferase